MGPGLRPPMLREIGLASYSFWSCSHRFQYLYLTASVEPVCRIPCSFFVRLPRFFRYSMLAHSHRSVPPTYSHVPYISCILVHAGQSWHPSCLMTTNLTPMVITDPHFRRGRLTSIPMLPHYYRVHLSAYRTTYTLHHRLYLRP